MSSRPPSQPRSVLAARSAVTLATGLVLTACGGAGSSAGSAPAANAAPTSAPATVATQSRGTPADRPRHHTPEGVLPDPVELSTLSEDGELVDPIVSLQEKLDAGEVAFSHDPVVGYLPSLLAALDIPVSSQVLIFSRTSLQTERIAPWTPRAIYFNDDVYIGHVGDDIDPMEARILEIASIDPDDGGAFYYLPQDPDTDPTFVREGQQCLMCHESNVTDDVPGVMVRSVLTDRMGRPIIPVQDVASTDRTPMERRFAGWYVTGTYGGEGHGGNVWAPQESHEIDLVQRARYLDEFDLTAGNDVTDLTDYFDTSIYLSEHSDLVALLVLAHQTRLHNVITLTHERAREALRRQDAARITRGIEIPEGGLLPITEDAIDGAVDQLVREMLFWGEAPLDGPVTGTSGFREDFEARGPFDDRGRTLRAFDLETRLFRYPLSFLVYTDAFDALPELVKTRFFRKVDDVLRGNDPGADFGHLDAGTRIAIREILMATKPEFAAAID